MKSQRLKALHLIVLLWSQTIVNGWAISAAGPHSWTQAFSFHHVALPRPRLQSAGEKKSLEKAQLPFLLARKSRVAPAQLQEAWEVCTRAGKPWRV